MAGNTHKKLEAWFRSLRIDHSKPGFCYDRSFMRAERNHARLLEDYADYIDSTRFDAGYLAHAQPVVDYATGFMHERLVEDGRKGACIDASMVLSGILDREGVWNYGIKGALTIRFDSETGLEPIYFQPVMGPGNPARTGHSWLVAPPYRVVDVTVSAQAYEVGQERFLPDYVLAKTARAARVEIEDLAEPVMVEAGYPGPDPAMARRIEKYGAFEVCFPSATLKYVSCAITASDGTPWEEWRNLCLSGRYPADIYREYRASQTTGNGRGQRGEGPEDEPPGPQPS